MKKLLVLAFVLSFASVAFAGGPQVKQYRPQGQVCCLQPPVATVTAQYTYKAVVPVPPPVVYVAQPVCPPPVRYEYAVPVRCNCQGCVAYCPLGCDKGCRFPGCVRIVRGVLTLPVRVFDCLFD